MDVIEQKIHTLHIKYKRLMEGHILPQVSNCMLLREKLS